MNVFIFYKIENIYQNYSQKLQHSDIDLIMSENNNSTEIQSLHDINHALQETDFLFAGLQPINQQIHPQPVPEEKRVIETESPKRIVRKRYFDDDTKSSESKPQLADIKMNRGEIIIKKRKRHEDEETKKDRIISEALNKFITQINTWDHTPDSHIVKLCVIDVSTNANNKILGDFLDELERNRFYYAVEFSAKHLFIQVYLYEPTVASFRHHGTLTLSNCRNLRIAINNKSKFFKK